MKPEKAKQLALHCMELERKRNHSLGLSGISMGAIEREMELQAAIECLELCTIGEFQHEMFTSENPTRNDNGANRNE